MKTILFLLATICMTISCSEKSQDHVSDSVREANEEQFTLTLRKHLDAVIDRDLETLKTTMSPEGKMQLIMQGTEIIHTADSFIEFHEGWFQDSLWTMETKILSTEVGPELGLAVTESMYREPERNGTPYYNRMIVTYVLEKENGHWYVINDHASSIKRSTDN